MPNPNARQIEEPTLDQHGDETHPAFGSITAHRVSSTPGAVLFDSDIKHNHSVVLTISTASRKRDLNHDWIHPGKELIEVQMSEAQWASFVSSMNTSGVPCTLRRTPDDWRIPELPFAPRMAESMAEVRGAADRAWEHIKAAMDTYEATPNVPKKAKDQALHSLRSAINNATSNVAYAGKTLTEHTENVVQRARADIEAMVTHHAQQLGIDASGMTQALELTAGDENA